MSTYCGLHIKGQARPIHSRTRKGAQHTSTFLRGSHMQVDNVAMQSPRSGTAFHTAACRGKKPRTSMSHVEWRPKLVRTCSRGIKYTAHKNKKTEFLSFFSLSVSTACSFCAFLVVCSMQYKYHTRMYHLWRRLLSC